MTTSAGDERAAAEFRRLAGVSSIISAMACCVDDLVQLAPEQLPDWLKSLGVPPGWRTASVEGASVAPARIVLRGQHPDGRWDGCETISVFGFTGVPLEYIVRDSADLILGDLGAEDIKTQTLAASLIPGMTAVRSDGYVTIAGQRVWVQYSIYVASSTMPSQGRLIQQSILSRAERRPELTEDIGQLCNAVQLAFLNGVDSP